MLPINRHPSPRELRSFSLVWLPLFVAAVGAVVWWRLNSPLTALVVWALGGLLVLGAFRSPEVARTIFVGSQTITYPIGLVISTLALAVLFYLVFTPIGWMMRRAGRDPLQLRRGTRSRWIAYEQKDDPADALKQY